MGAAKVAGVPGRGPAHGVADIRQQGDFMTITSAPRESYVAAPPPGDPRRRSPIWKIVTTTDHKTLGMMYLINSFAFFMFGGVLALMMRA